MALKDIIKRDIDTVFMNPNDYCDNLVIHTGQVIMSSIVYSLTHLYKDYINQFGIN